MDNGLSDTNGLPDDLLLVVSVSVSGRDALFGVCDTPMLSLYDSLLFRAKSTTPLFNLPYSWAHTYPIDIVIVLHIFDSTSPILWRK